MQGMAAGCTLDQAGQAAAPCRLLLFDDPEQRQIGVHVHGDGEAH